ncbi:MAG: hypothetical protein GKR95_16635 [Gammaproteobacteria bacterium]|nr:hypothetical protein [Gammaproteobacteria bacterium]
MSVKDYIATYLEGWRLGNPGYSLAATAPGFYYSDPNTGKILRDDFEDFMSAFKDDAAQLCSGKLPVPFLTYSNVVIDDSETPVTIWCWWCVTGTEFQGAALIKADDTGILSEQIAYFTHLP